MLQKYAKFWVALVAALGVLAPLLTDGISGAEGIAIFIAFMGALGVRQVPNVPLASDPPVVHQAKPLP